MNHSGRHILAAGTGFIAALALTASSHGQVSQYQEVEQIVADMNPLTTSLRRLDVGLRHPVGFQQVYLAPGEPGKLMRVQGGLHAVFAQSLYVQHEEGIEPLIAPNTVFRIGPRQSAELAVPMVAPNVLPIVHGADRSDQAADPRRVTPQRHDVNIEREPGRDRAEPVNRPSVAAWSQEQDAQADVVPAAAMHAPGTILGDDEYRSKRLRDLLQQAARNERAHQDDRPRS